MTEPDAISFHAGAVTLVGRVRAANEDAVMSTPSVVGVADGMGGHAAGEVASAEAVRVLQFAVGYHRLDELVAAVHYANRSIFERASEDRSLEGMGTTICTAGVLVDDDASSEHNAVGILNVGDSRAYLFAAGELQQLSEDHSYVASLVRSGAISPEEAENHPRRNVVTRALGIEPLVTIDTWILSPRQGDRVLLCSDGLTNEVRDAEIQEILATVADPQAAAEQLAQRADENGGRDNISVVVADIVGPLDHAEPPGERCRRFATPAVDPDILDIPDDERRPDPEATDNRLATLEHPIVVPTGDHPASDSTVDDAAVMISEAELEAVSQQAVAGSIDDDDVADARGHAGEDTEVDDGDSLPDDTDPDKAGRVAAGVAESGGDGDIDTANDVDHDDDTIIVEPKRSWWRIIVFVVAVLGLLGVGLWLVWANNQAGWYVKDNDGTVALFEGDPNGFLWIGPNLVTEFPLDTEDLQSQAQAQLKEGRRHNTRSEAETFLERLSEQTTTTTTTTTSTTTTTTTIATTTTLVPPTTAPLVPGDVEIPAADAPVPPPTPGGAP